MNTRVLHLLTDNLLTAIHINHIEFIVKFILSVPQTMISKECMYLKKIFIGTIVFILNRLVYHYYSTLFDGPVSNNLFVDRKTTNV